jgi:hypothetical protein
VKNEGSGFELPIELLRAERRRSATRSGRVSTPADDEALLRLGIAPFDDAPSDCGCTHGDLCKPPCFVNLGPPRLFIDGVEIGTVSDVKINFANNPARPADR